MAAALCLAPALPAVGAEYDAALAQRLGADPQGMRAYVLVILKTGPTRVPDGPGRVELAKFHRPAAIAPEPRDAPANTLGLRRVMFAVDDIDDVVARLRAHGAELVGEVVQYENIYRLCYVRGPEGIVVGLAEELG